MSPETEEAIRLRCTKCGAELDAGARFCTQCGARVEQECVDSKTRSIQNIFLAVISALVAVLVWQGIR